VTKVSWVERTIVAVVVELGKLGAGHIVGMLAVAERDVERMMVDVPEAISHTFESPIWRWQVKELITALSNNRKENVVRLKSG
jgi:hypothetical protein